MPTLWSASGLAGGGTAGMSEAKEGPWDRFPGGWVPTL